MRKILLTGLMSLLLLQTGCYKKDYLAAQEEIARLENDKSQLNSQVSSLQGQISGLESQLSSANNTIVGLEQLVDDLHGQIDDLEQSLDASEVELELAGVLIAQLEQDLEVLKEVFDLTETLADSVKSGIQEILQQYLTGEASYEDVLDTIAVLSGFETGVYELVGVWLTDVSNSALDDFVTNLDEINLDDITPRDEYFDMNSNDVSRSVQTRTYLVDHTTGQNMQFKYWREGHWVNNRIESIDVLDRNYSIITEEFTGSWGVDGVTYNDVKSTYSWVLKKSDLSTASEGIVTEDEVLNTFQEIGNGLYGDPLYATLDFNDINDYIRVFQEDALRHNVDMSHITQQTPHLEFSDRVGDAGACAWASWVCTPNYIWVEYDPDCWGPMPDGPYNPNRLEVMWHEFGHSNMSYPHPINEEHGYVDYGYNGYFDIMGYSSIQYFEGTSDWEGYDGWIQTGWDEAVDRFFGGTDHELYNCTTTKGSGGVIVEIDNPDFNDQDDIDHQNHKH